LNRFVADFVGNTNFIEGALVSTAANGHGRVATALGESDLAKSARVVVSIRPEDVELSEAVPELEPDDNLRHGIVVAKVFLGDYLDFQVKLGEFIILARVHPSLRTPIGDPIHVRMRANKCIAVAEACET
jgi:iron(III) transport system ATP-binding protein